ncbi:hypothetical protein QO207_18605 [Pseudomonas sp. CAN2814]|uniref:hypothetical protein n=1 Tax=Pseudomonas sp. CAN1 TaxID=3046726 RepID=UPI002647A161|nr:hypothetical protein [Pseudomonas sp. CAN1]MDN6858609.1 hypothetical protein [Pseudomonas sp. CAN1]
MVFLVIDQSGYQAFKALGDINSHLWLTADIMAEPEIDSLRAKGMEVSVFNYKLNADDLVGIAAAVETIREHHPTQKVWVAF